MIHILGICGSPVKKSNVVQADTLIVASPVYLGRMSGHLASVLDRLRCIHYGKHYGGGMKHKVLKDEYGLKTARATAKSMVELAKIMQAGKKTKWSE